MESLQNPTWKYIGLGSACVVAAASLAYLRQRSKDDCGYNESVVKEANGMAGEKLARNSAHANKSSPCTSSPVEQRSQKPSAKPNIGVRWENVEAWAAGLKKKNTADLPLLVEWTERILKEQPDHKALPLCLKALALIVGGHREVDRVSAICIQASTHCPEQALEVLNAVFKDGRQREGFMADLAVVDFALDVLKKSLVGEASRSSYQRACRLLDWLALEPANRPTIASRSGCQTLLEVMEKFHDDPGVLLEGCACLQHLAEEKSLDSERACSVILASSEKCRENGELQWRALAAMHALPVPRKEVRVSMVKVSCAAATQHPCFDAVIEWTAKLLYKLAVSDSAVLDEMRYRKEWLEQFRTAPLHLRKVNKQAEHWVSELCKLCA